MKFSCDQCNAQYMIADEKVGSKGVKVKCKKCAHIIIVKPATADESKPAPQPQSDGFGGFNEPTQAMSADQLASLKQSSGDGDDLFGSDPFATPPSDHDGDSPVFGGDSPGFGGDSPGFGGDSPGFGGDSPGFGGDSPGFGGDSPVFGGDSPGFGGSPSFAGDAPADDSPGFGGDSPGFGDSSSFGGDAAGFAPAGVPNDEPGDDPGPDLPADHPAAAFGANFGASFGDSPGAQESPTANFGEAGFGSGGFGEQNSGDLALDALRAVASAPAPSTREPGEKEWYVAIDEAQIGPVDIAEIEQRWDALEVDEDTLAWKAGMQDWVPVAEIAELAYLVTERPQHKSGASAGTVTGASIGAASAVSAGLGPVSFGGETGGAAAGAESVSWTPSAASALSSLVQDELTVSPQTQTTAAAPAPSPSDLAMPSFGASDLFGGGGGQAAAPAMTAPPAADPFVGGGGGWSVPKPEPKSGGLKPIHLALAGMGVLLVGLIVVVVFVVLRPPVTTPGLPPTDPAVAAQQTTLAARDPVKPTVEDSGTAAVADAKPAEPDPVAPPVSDAGKGRRKKRGASSTSTPPSSASTPSKPSKPPKGPADDIFKSTAKKSLSKADIMGGVKDGMAAVTDCIQGARSKGELTPGKHTLVLNWTIKANGKVANPSVKGPSYVLGTSIPACFARGMRKWSFPASQSDSPVRNFPFGPFNIR